MRFMRSVLVEVVEFPLVSGIQEMQKVFYAEAAKYDVLPLDNSTP
jgi:hypothetical protein